MKKYFLLLILFSFFFCQTAAADFYKWVDEKGQTQITDYPPPSEKAAKNVEIHKTESEVIPPPPTQDDASKIKAKKKIDIVLYTKNDCKDCDKAKDFLKSKNVDFTEYNMDTDETAVTKRKEIDSDEDVPFAVINRYQIHGFKESAYEKALQAEP